MNLTEMALTVAQKCLTLFKKAAMDAKECGWTLQPEEFWEQEDDSALALIDRALAAQPGAPRPLFADLVAEECEERSQSLQMMVDMMADTISPCGDDCIHPDHRHLIQAV